MSRIVALTVLSAAALLHGAADAGAQQVSQWELTGTPPISYTPIVVQDTGLSGFRRDLVGGAIGASVGAAIGWWLIGPELKVPTEGKVTCSFIGPFRSCTPVALSDEEREQKRRDNKVSAAFWGGVVLGALGVWVARQSAEHGFSFAPWITPAFAGTPAVGLTGRWRVGWASR